MSVSTVDVNLVRRFPLQGDINLGPVLIREDEPRTPQFQQALRDIRLSSPVANYDLEPMQQSQGPRTYSMQHKVNDRERQISTKEAVAKMENRMSTMEKEMEEQLRKAKDDLAMETSQLRQERDSDMEQLRKAKDDFAMETSQLRKSQEDFATDIGQKQEREKLKEQDKMVLRWEVCSRMAQGLNDSLKGTIEESTNPKLRQALEDISSSENRSRYLPQLFTQWWVFWHKTAPEGFPKLPSALASLSEKEWAYYLSRKPLIQKVHEAAETIWDSNHRSAIEAMLLIYHMRPKDRHSILHPDPSTASAHEFVNSNPTITEEHKMTMKFIIDHGTRWDSSGEEVFLFSHNTYPWPQ